MSQEPKYTLFYVLNGLLDGERGVTAATTGLGVLLDDGHYYLIDGDPDGTGPYPSRDDARDAAELFLKKSEREAQIWAFPTKPTDERPHQVTQIWVDESVGDENHAWVEYVPGKTSDSQNDYWKISLLGSYETLVLCVSSSKEHAIRAFDLLLETVDHT